MPRPACLVQKPKRFCTGGPPPAAAGHDAQAFACSQPGVVPRGSTRATHASHPCAWKIAHSAFHTKASQSGSGLPGCRVHQALGKLDPPSEEGGVETVNVSAAAIFYATPRGQHDVHDDAPRNEPVEQGQFLFLQRLDLAIRLDEVMNGLVRGFRYCELPRGANRHVANQSRVNRVSKIDDPDDAGFFMWINDDVADTEVIM